MSTVVKTVPSFSPTGEAIHSIESTAITCAVGDVIGSTPQARTIGGSPHATAAASDGWVSRCSCPRSLMGVFAKICSHAELVGGASTTTAVEHPDATTHAARARTMVRRVALGRGVRRKT